MADASARGRFVWHDLVTTDPRAALDFYATVAGWGTEQWNGGGGPPDTMWMANGAPLGGVMPLSKSAEGTPPHWISYVCVPNADATAKQAAAPRRQVTAPAHGHSDDRQIRDHRRSAGRADRDLHTARAGARARRGAEQG
jgi:predicted enzyme related to lactoylglutathione lyase